VILNQSIGEDRVLNDFELIESSRISVVMEGGENRKYSINKIDLIRELYE